MQAEKGRWLRSTDGTIYGYSERLARNPKLREVSEEEAFPEKFMTEKQKRRVPQVDLSAEAEAQPEPEPRTETQAALDEEASRGLGAAPKPKAGLKA